jgi:hypothetical protein
MIYGKGNITSATLTAMHEIARHETHLEQTMQQEWNRQEHHRQMQAQAHTQTIKGLSKKQLRQDIDTSIAVARLKMRHEMSDIDHHHHSIDSRNQSQNLAHLHMEIRKASLDKIATQHQSHIHENIAQVRNMQKLQQKQQQQEIQKQMQREHGMGMEL